MYRCGRSVGASVRCANVLNGAANVDVGRLLQVILQTELGQLLDLTSAPMGGPVDLTRFTLERCVW